MPRIAKSISTNSSSEIISNAQPDSESSNIVESSFGTGDEGTRKTDGDVDPKKVGDANTSRLYLSSSSTKLLIGLSCSLVAVTGTIGLIYCGIQLNNNPDNNSRIGYSSAFATGAIMAAVGSLSTIWCACRTTDPNPQLPNA